MASPTPMETPSRRRALARTPAAAPAPASADLHTISLLVRDAPGVLVRVAMVFSRRGYNIESLVVSPSAEAGLRRVSRTRPPSCVAASAAWNDCMSG